MQLNFAPGKAARVLGTVAGLLVAHHVLLKAAEFLFFRESDSPAFRFYSKLFTVNAEGIVPTAFSMLSLLACAALLYIIADAARTKRHGYVRSWKGLAIIFLFLAIDEGFEIHERFTDNVRDAFNTSGWLYHAWVIPYGLLFIVFAIAYARFTLALPSRTRRLFVCAAVLYVFGAVGMELFGGHQADTKGTGTIAYAACATIEELFEMAGIVVFIYALLSHLRTGFSPPPRVEIAFT